ncbi:hypothetical protein PUN28_003165 [Cardiocondyla obscurior]|uniref:Uncharacterized protein n=1 Tax=Cardiocondyla obscurior TaxID=286306 RepID=A0AAW2GKB7_9HYME
MHSRKRGRTRETGRQRNIYSAEFKLVVILSYVKRESHTSRAKKKNTVQFSERDSTKTLCPTERLSYQSEVEAPKRFSAQQ